MTARRFLQVDGILSPVEVERYRRIYDELLDRTSAGGPGAKHRYDLGSTDDHLGGSAEEPGAATAAAPARERITQLMWPSDQHDELRPDSSVLHRRLHTVARVLVGEDAAFDFDMLIDKRSDAPTPAHQDQSYWADLADKRAVSFWVALDDARPETGCMWYRRGDPVTEPVRAHRKTLGGKGHALECDGTESELVCAPLRAGSCVGHSGRTLHYSRGNAEGCPRRAYIVNFRPRAALEEMRRKGFDHGRGGAVENKINSTT